MLDGVDLSNSNSVRDALLLHGRQRRDTVEYLKFLALLKAMLLDRSKQEDVNTFNELLQDIAEYYYPGAKKPKKTWQDQAKLLQDFEKFKGKKIPLKNFTQVK